MYYNASFQHNQDAPVNHLGEYSTDLVSNKSLAFIDEGAKSGKPFFITMAPVGPHCTIGNPLPDGSTNSTPPEPAKRHETLFFDAKVPRAPNFNPQNPSGASWVAQLPLQSDENIAFNDNYYVKRLQSLQAIDEMVTATIDKLRECGVLDNTYIIFSSDNGYHIGQHRTQPGKQLPYEEDTNVPFIVRGPGVQAGATRDFVTSHTDLAPTFLSWAGVAPHSDFDGQVIPFDAAATNQQSWEHVNIEHWGTAAADGDGGFEAILHPNTTYKALRVASDQYNYFYAVWCNNDHELYDMKVSESRESLAAR
jgi:N-acetylglucosamine-6-sulfatase